MTPVDVSVSLCTYNRAAMLQATLESLVRQETGGAFSFEIIVVDDGSTDQTPTILKEMAERTPIPIRRFREERVGVGAARARGVTESQGQWIAFIDDDETAEPDWLARLLAAAKAAKADCAWGPLRLRLPPGTEEPLAKTPRKHLMETVPTGWLQRHLTWSGPGTCNALVRARLFKEVGPFDPSFRMVGEDQDFFRRVRRAGYKIVFTPEAVVHHFIPSSRLEPDYLLTLSGRNGMMLAYFDWRERGPLMTLFIGVLRIGHVLAKGLSTLFRCLLTRDRGLLFGLASSAKTTAAYWKEIACHVVPGMGAPGRKPGN